VGDGDGTLSSPSTRAQAVARSGTLFQVDEYPDRRLVRRALDEPDAGRERAIVSEVDLVESVAERAAVVHTVGVERPVAQASRRMRRMVAKANANAT
jgi:hypothetical protein